MYSWTRLLTWTRLLKILVLGVTCLGLAGCPFPPRIYRMDIRQGNAITPEMVQALRKGMPKDEVQDILGTPALQHMLNSERWDYYYYFKSGITGAESEKHFTVFFHNGRLIHWN